MTKTEFVLVPRKLTQAMKEAVRDAGGSQAVAYAVACWPELLDAAPIPEELCEDEGCDHYGTDHVCVSRATPTPEHQPEVAVEPVAWHVKVWLGPHSGWSKWVIAEPETIKCVKETGCTHNGYEAELRAVYTTPPVVEEAVKAEPRVRELVWVFDYVRDNVWYGNAAIPPHYRASGNVWWIAGKEGTKFICDSLDEAKAAAQADFTARILSALSSGDAS